VLLWTDTFSSAFDPAIVRAATAVLTKLGYAVELPPRTVCCGLTWTSTGQVATARRVLGRSLAAIEPWLTAGVPVVGLEPSCTAALRADATELLPDHPLVPRLATGVRTFAELLADHVDDLRGATVAPGGRALVQVHCHQHAELGAEADRAVMAALGVDAEVLDSGCCGLAGNFGFEKGHYAVSMACAERVLLPAVRAADPDVAVLADGFSCRTQLRQAGTREPVHLAQVAARALGLPDGESGVSPR
jgi:Fe-S oxidoreductase